MKSILILILHIVVWLPVCAWTGSNIGRLLNLHELHLTTSSEVVCLRLLIVGWLIAAALLLGFDIYRLWHATIRLLNDLS